MDVAGPTWRGSFTLVVGHVAPVVTTRNVEVQVLVSTGGTAP